MKNILFLVSLTCLMWSCSSNYFQICKVSSSLPISQSGAYEFTNEEINIQYDFWSEGGNICFTIKNNTNNILYIDLSKSFLIKNGIAYDYFLNRTVSTSSALSSSKTAGASANALVFFSSFYKNIPGSISTHQVNSVASQHSITVASEEQPIVTIPPHAAKIFAEYAIMDSRFQDCELQDSPSKKNNASMSFNLLTTPVRFYNTICYRLDDSAKEEYIENEFFVSQVTNQHYKSTIHKVEVGCPSDSYKTKIETFINISPKEFYIEYNPRSQKKSDNSSTSKRNGDSIYGD